MIWQQTDGFGWSNSRNGALEMIATQQPYRSDAQLLRSFAHPSFKLAGDAHEHVPGFVEMGMLAGQGDRRLAGMLGAPVKYFESKGMAVTWGWREMDAAAHARAFTVAGVTKLDVLQDLRAELRRALNEGQTFADFRKNLIPRLQAKGWWGKLAQTDPETGEMAGKGLTPRRLETIFRANVQSAYMAGRYRAHRENVAARPWWQYVALLDGRTRPQHSALNGRTFRHDDPFWQKFYPPNGFNCRCRVRAFTDAEVRRRGIAISISGRNLEQVELPDPYRPGQTLMRPRFEHAPGKYITPDIGWEGNPGAMALWDPAATLPDCSWSDPGVADMAARPIVGNCLGIAAGQRTWKDFGRADLRDVPAALRHASPGMVERAASREYAVEVLAAELGLTAEQSQRIIKTPVETLVIWRDLLPHMVEKEADGRERYARFILPTLLDPFEVYLTEYADGRARPRYIGLFQGDRDMMCIVRRNRDGSFLWNLMHADHRKMNAHRVGELIYGK